MRPLSAVAVMVLLVASSCNGFIGESGLTVPQGPPIEIIDPDYVVLRPLHAIADSAATTATVNGQVVSFDPEDRIMDLRHLDPRTATVDKRSDDRYVVFIGTTDEGDQRLRAWTAQNLEKQLGIFVAGHLISAPLVKSPISAMIVLDGDLTKPQAEEVFARLRRGGAAV